MKAILASHDLTKVRGGVELAEKMTGKPRNNINIAVINEAAAVEFGDHRWAIDTLKNLADNFGGSIEIVHLMALSKDQIRDRINANDMVFVLGGSPEWLKIVFDKTGFSDMRPEILKNKLYVGSSAGSMILGHRSSNKVQEQMYGTAEYFGVEKYLDWLDLSVLPHFEITGGDRSKKWATCESKSVNYPVYALSDRAAVVVDDDKISVIGDDYLKLVGGDIVEFKNH